jgi:chromosome segregation ATPase
MVLRTLNGHCIHTDPSVNSSPTSTIPSRTAVSSSASSHLPNLDPRKNSSPVEAGANAHQAAIQLLKERHELEKEALLSALSEAKKELKGERAEKDELKAELGEMAVYVEELETKLGEALARIRWMEKEISLLRTAVSSARVSSSTLSMSL